ncbi:uncharacterized protein LY79DRAFT_657005 [Colletotrichum navitas]|uniref:Uncharacterized protein n=1 Tax=Colletotrichum navitas TaxID=681940 RepID=A0AAD8Q681_9PEZI|nr:uncharacterized protein LY79DRAFT_657005 [Colletotrichum navitas]KAK1596527.1 hypothetical protein LY79DRAFT_657005 [Colletotrichum navitas]
MMMHLLILTISGSTMTKIQTSFGIARIVLAYPNLERSVGSRYSQVDQTPSALPSLMPGSIGLPYGEMQGGYPLRGYRTYYVYAREIRIKLVDRLTLLLASLLISFIWISRVYTSTSKLGQGGKKCSLGDIIVFASKQFLTKVFDG